MPSTKTEVVRSLNDELRVGARGNGRVHISVGIASLGTLFAAQALEAVRSFDGFDADNDPHGEHDGAMLEVQTETVFWKIDYYDPSLTVQSADPADPTVTRRVLTVMLAEEY